MKLKATISNEFSAFSFDQEKFKVKTKVHRDEGHEMLNHYFEQLAWMSDVLEELAKLGKAPKITFEVLED